VVLGAVSPSMRATAMAMSIFFCHALGDLPSIPLVGLLSDKLGSLPHAMFALPFMMGLCACAWVVAARIKSSPSTSDANITVDQPIDSIVAPSSDST
jgi:hypothetical protein